MPSILNPYIGFKDNAREALEFYHGVFGGKLDLNTFGENHASEDPAEADKIMHGQITADNGMVLMCSDAPKEMPLDKGSQISISLSGEDEEELMGYYTKLSEGGNVFMPINDAPWGSKFGMLSDKFGVNWMVNIGTPMGK